MPVALLQSSDDLVPAAAAAAAAAGTHTSSCRTPSGIDTCDSLLIITARLAGRRDRTRPDGRLLAAELHVWNARPSR